MVEIETQSIIEKPLHKMNSDSDIGAGIAADWSLNIQTKNSQTELFKRYTHAYATMVNLILDSGGTLEPDLIRNSVIDLVGSTVEEREALVKEIEMNRFDPLTGMLKRVPFEEKLKLVDPKTLPSCRMLFFDVDDYGKFNKLFGYSIGDEVLKKVSEAMKKSVAGSSSILGRWAGDEFVLLYKYGGTETDPEKLNEIINNEIKSIFESINSQLEELKEKTVTVTKDDDPRNGTTIPLTPVHLSAGCVKIEESDLFNPKQMYDKLDGPVSAAKTKNPEKRQLVIL